MATTLTTVTTAGLEAALNAGTGGPLIKISHFKIGARSQAEGLGVDPSDTDVTEYVGYTGTANFITYNVIDVDTVVWNCLLEHDVGDFDMGNIGLFMEDGTMFAKMVLPKKEFKFKSQPPSTIGNRKIISFVLKFSSQAAVIDFSILIANEMSLPTVPTELELQPPNLAPFNAYLVQNHTKLGQTVLALRFNGEWHYAVTRTNPQMSELIISVQDPTAEFDAGATIGKLVYWDAASNTYKRANPTTTRPLGIRISEWEIATMGVVEMEGVTFTDGAYYYASQTVAGDYTETAGDFPIGFALDTEHLWVDFSAMPDPLLIALGQDNQTGPPSGIFSVTGLEVSAIGVGTSWATVHTVGAAPLSSIFTGMHVTNRHTSNVYFWARIILGQAPGTIAMISPGYTVAPNESLEILSRMLILGPNDQLQLQCSVASVADFYAMYEVTNDPKYFRGTVSLNDNTQTKVYNPAVDEAGVIHSIIVANRDASNQRTITIQRTPTAGNPLRICNAMPVFAAASVEIMDTELRCTNPYSIDAIAATGNIDVWLSGRKI